MGSEAPWYGAHWQDRPREELPFGGDTGEPSDLLNLSFQGTAMPGSACSFLRRLFLTSSPRGFPDARLYTVLIVLTLDLASWHKAFDVLPPQPV